MCGRGGGGGQHSEYTIFATSSVEYTEKILMETNKPYKLVN